MTQVFLSLGSNISRTQNIRAGLNQLETCFGELRLSPVYESEPVGFEGDCFYNLVVEIDCSVSLSELTACLKKIEDDNGRQRGGPKFSARSLDIDILTFGDVVGTYQGIELPRAELYFNGFVLLPMAKLAPMSVDAKTGKSYQSLWGSYREKIEKKQKLWRVDFVWKASI